MMYYFIYIIIYELFKYCILHSFFFIYYVWYIKYYIYLLYVIYYILYINLR